MKPELRQIFATTKPPNSETFILSSAFLILSLSPFPDLSYAYPWSLVSFCFLFLFVFFSLNQIFHFTSLPILISISLKNYMILFYRKKKFTSVFQWFSSVQSVAQSCLTLCDPMNRSTPGLPVHHQLLEFTQTHVHRVGDAIQPSDPLSSPSPPAPNPSQHQSLFQ